MVFVVVILICLPLSAHQGRGDCWSTLIAHGLFAYACQGISGTSLDTLTPALSHQGRGGMLIGFRGCYSHLPTLVSPSRERGKSPCRMRAATGTRSFPLRRPLRPPLRLWRWTWEKRGTSRRSRSRWRPPCVRCRCPGEHVRLPPRCAR